MLRCPSNRVSVVSVLVFASVALVAACSGKKSNGEGGATGLGTGGNIGLGGSAGANLSGTGGLGGSGLGGIIGAGGNKPDAAVDAPTGTGGTKADAGTVDASTLDGVLCGRPGDPCCQGNTCGGGGCCVNARCIAPNSDC